MSQQNKTFGETLRNQRRGGTDVADRKPRSFNDPPLVPGGPMGSVYYNAPGTGVNKTIDYMRQRQPSREGGGGMKPGVEELWRGLGQWDYLQNREEDREPLAYAKGGKVIKSERY